MSFTDDFMSELDKKKKKKKKNSSSTSGTSATGGKSYSEKFMDALGDDISPLPSPTMASIHKYGEDDIAPLSKYQIMAQSKQKSNKVKSGYKIADFSSVTSAEDFAENSGYKSTKNDKWWSGLTSQYGLSYDDLAYEYINNADLKRDEIKKASLKFSGTNETEFYEKGYDHLTADEVKIYNYLYATGGKKKAEEYLKELAETLNTRKAESEFEDIEGKTALEILRGVDVGLDQFESGMKNFGNMLVGKDDYIAPTSTQILGGMIRQDLADDTMPLWYNFKDKQWEDEILGATAGQFAYDNVTTASNMIPTIAASAASNMILPGSGIVVGGATMGSSAAGNAYQSALNEGYDKDAAKVYATGVGALEALLQTALGGISKLGGTSKYISKAVSGIDNALLRFSLEFGGRVGSEALEEGLQEVLDPILQNAILGADEDVNWEEVAYSALLGGVMGATMGGDSNNLSHSDQKVVNKVYEAELAKKKEDGKTLTKKEKSKIYDSVVERLEKGQIDIDTIDSMYGGEGYTSYRDAVKGLFDSDTYKDYKKALEEESTLAKEIEELGKKEGATPADNFRYTELMQKQKDSSAAQVERKAFIDAEVEKITGMRTNLTNEIVKKVGENSKLVESYREFERGRQAFEADLSKYTGKQREAVERAVKSGVLNNTYRSHELVNVLSKIEADKGITFDYTNNAKLKESGFAVEGVTVNGFANKSKGAVTLNMQSAKAWESVVGHEITHVLEGTDAYSELRNALYAYAESKGELEGRRAYLTELYQNMDADVEAELTADLVGDYLFTDKDFVSKLTGNRTLFQKIYDEIKYLWNVATGKEKTEIEKVKAEFDRVWKEYSNNNETTEESSESREYGDAGLDKFGFDEKGQVKYSISDSEGNQLSKEQREYFADSKIRDENGNLKVMYHGTPSGDFTVFRDGTYFTENKWYADLYQNPGASSLNSRKTVTNPKTYKVYLDIKKPFDIADAEARDIYINEYIKGGNAVGINPYMSDAEYAKIDYIDWTEGEDLREFLVDNGYDYDGLVLDEGAVGGYGDDVKYRGKSYVTFSPEQVKDVDNKNPTSDPDIRFSLSNSVEETKDLMALHNLHTNEVLKQLEMGGLPYPSVAITKPDMISHDDFGEVSLILKKSAIDPKQSRYNKVYSADAYTPTFPQIDYEADEQAALRIEDKVRGLFDKVPEDYQRSIRSLRDFTNLNDELNRAGGEQRLIERYENDYGMKQLYLAEKGEAVPTVINRTETQITEMQREEYQFIVDKMGAETFKSFRPKDGYTSPMTARKQWFEQNGDALKTAYQEWLAGDPNLTEDDVAEVMQATPDLWFVGEARRVYEFIETGGLTVKEEPDFRATEAKIDEKIADSNYKQWLNDMFNGIEGQSGLRNNKDKFTPSGKRRDFSQLHDPVTVDNIVKIMRKEDQKGQGAFGTGNIRGASAKEYSSIAEIKQNSDKLSKMTQEEHDEINQHINDVMYGIARRYADGGDIIDAKKTICEAVAKSESKEGIARYLKQYDYVYEYTDSIGDDIIELRNYIRNLPTPYFEAKPQRAVGFDEVGVFVIPRNADVKLKQELLNRGYSIAEYDPDVEGDRQKVVNQFEEYKFSLSNVGEESAPVGTPLRELALDGDVAPVGEGVAPAQKAPSLADIPVLPDDELETGTYEAIKPSGEMVAEAPLPNEIRPMTEEEANAIQDEKAKADAAVEGLPKSRKQLHKNIINDMKATFSSGGYDLDDVLSKAKDLSTFATVDNTPQRVMEKALGYKEGQILADLTVNKVAQNETEGIKWLNSFTDRKNGLLAQISNQYRIKPGSKESAAAQMYAEGFYVNDNNDIVAYGDAELAKDFPDASVQNRIKGLASDPRIRQIYDETLEAINKSRARNAYPEIQRLENYFLHFRAMDDTFSKLGIPFNPNDIRAKDLPTDLNGVTADLKPGQPYFASSMHRKGKRTSFDLLGGLERYLTSAKNQIYHIDDIQNLRALRNYIADTYGQAKGLEVIDLLSEEEAQDRIEKVYDAHLSTFAKFLNEEANVLAGKTALIDRGLEGIIGRRGMTFLDTVNRQVGSNMVGYSASSAIVNFDALPRALAKTNKFDFVKGFAQMVSNRIGSIFGKSDSFSENSPVIIRRKGADRFYRTPFQKASDGGYVLMGVVDDISTEIIARAKYNELTRKGMDEQTAHFETDKWVSKLMGDRSLGQQPLIFNSKMLGLVTKFQLEVRNNLDSQFYDTIQEAKVSSEDIENALARNAKTAAKVTSTFVQLAVAQHVFGKAFESIAGYNPSFDIISVLATLFGFDDDEDDEDTVLDNIEQGFLELLEDLPYTSVLTGGRIPIANALPVTELIKGTDSYGNEKSRWETFGEAAPYYILPGGYGQIKKTAAGLNMFSDDHPVTGSYTDSGSLRFPVEDTPLNRVQAALFGQYASKNAREYFDNDYAPLDEKQIQEYIDVDMPIKEYREYREGLKKQETLEDKFDYISGLDLPVAKKNILINNVVDRKEAVDLEGYEDFGSLEEFDFATKNPEKYAFAKSVGGYSAYQTYSDALYDIKADKDASGKSINGSRKEKVLNYINNLDADYYTKIILWKSEYPSDDNYNREIVDYINNRSDLSYEDKVAILTELGFRVTADGQIYSD